MSLTAELLAEIAAIKDTKQQKQVLDLAYKKEWEHCKQDPLYWLDASKHFPSPKWPKGTPYVFTCDRHPMYRCDLCVAIDPENDIVHLRDNRQKHLNIRHNIDVDAAQDIQGYFQELSPVRPFTIKEYVPPIVDHWLKVKYMAVEKSRDMMATWLISTLYTWDTLYHEGRQNIFQSEDASKTRELVEDRAFFIYNHQPKFLKDQHKAFFRSGTSKGGELKVPSLNSQILGFPQGADQIRQYHPSGFFSDEAAFQSSAGASFAAIKPSIQHGGRYTAVSSANPSFFMHLCKDTTHTLQG